MVRGAIWTGLHTVVSLPLAFLVNVLLARVLGVADYGRLAYLTTVIGIVSGIAGLAVTTALVQFGAKAHAAGRPDEVRRYLSGSQGFSVLVSGPIIALVVLLLVDVEPWLMAVALSFGVFAPSFLGTANQCLTIENRSDRSAQLAMINNVLVQIAVVVAVLSVGSPDAVWSARITVTGIMLMLPVWFITREYRQAVLRPRPPWTLPRAFWLFALPTAAAGLVGTLAVDRTQLIVLDWFADPVAMGLFGLAFGLAGHIFAPAQAFIGPLVPGVSGLAEVDSLSMRRAFLRTTRAASAIGGALIAPALPALALLVPRIYGEEFGPAADLVVVLGLAGAVSLIGSPHHAFLMARLAGRRLLWINVVALVVNLSIALALIPIFGAWGATLSCAAGIIVRSVQLTTGEARAIRVSMQELARSTTSIFIGSALALLAWVCVRSLDASDILLAIIVSVLCFALYVSLIKITRSGMAGDDVEAITRVFAPRMQPWGKRVLWLLRGSP